MLSSSKKYYSVVIKMRRIDIAGSGAGAPEAEQFLFMIFGYIQLLGLVCESQYRCLDSSNIVPWGFILFCKPRHDRSE